MGRYSCNMCMSIPEVNVSVIDAKDKLLTDLLNAHQNGLVNDVTFICNDGVKLSSNKSMLSVRSPFFYTMFFGGFKNTVEEEIEFKSCDSEVMKNVLDYVWSGIIDLESLCVEVILKLLETSRMLCLDTLVKGIGDYLIHNINTSKFSHDELLESLDFAMHNQFDALAQCLLFNIDKNLGRVAECSRFTMLTEASMISILTFSPRTSLESVNFEAFLVWIKHKEEIVETTKNEMLNAFDLNKFDKAYLLNKVRRTGYFADEAIFDVLEVKEAEEQKKIRSLEANLTQAQSELQRWSNRDTNKFKKENIVDPMSHHHR